MWHLCSRVCGGGSQVRTRNVHGAPRPGSGHHSCPPAQESRRCNMHRCTLAPRRGVQLATRGRSASITSGCNTDIGVSCAFFACPSFSVCDRSRTRCVCPPGSCRVRTATTSASASLSYQYTCQQPAPTMASSDINAYGTERFVAPETDTSAQSAPLPYLSGYLRGHTALSILAAIGLVGLVALLAALALRCSSMQLSFAREPAAAPAPAAFTGNGLAMSKTGMGGAHGSGARHTPEPEGEDAPPEGGEGGEGGAARECD